MAIKNFKASRKQAKKLSEKAILVSDYMTRNLITFTPDQSVLQVMDLLIKHRISGGPVVDKKGRLLGIISEGDCMKQISESRYFNLPMDDITVEKYMITNVETIDGNLNIFDAANKFLNSKRRRFPILERGKLVGQISQKDVLKAAISINDKGRKKFKFSDLF